MALQTANQFQLIPDVAGAISSGLKTGQQFRQIQTEREQRELQPQIQELTQRAVQGDQEALKQLLALSPESAQNVLSLQTQQQTLLSAQNKDRTISAVNSAVQIKNLPDLQSKLTFAKKRQADAAQSGVQSSIEDANELVQLLETGNEAQINPAIDGMVSLGVQLKILDKSAIAGAEGVSEVQSSKILPGGLVQIVRKDGTVDTIPAEEADAELIKAAERRGAELQGLRAGERKAGTASIELGIDAFKKIATIRGSIRNLNEGIKLLQTGAKTGAIESRLPSIRAASVKLDNLRNKMGLDVIGGTTFGALSESELNFALDTALPKGLDEPELIKWMTEKRDAQAKLVTNLEEAASFLSTPGNTVAEFIKIKKAEDKDTQAETTPTTGQATNVGRFTVEVVE